MKWEGVRRLFTERSDDWETPRELFFRLHREYGPFDLDPCGQAQVHTPAWHIGRHGGGWYDGSTDAMDGKIRPWYGIVYMFPPPREAREWVVMATLYLLVGWCKKVISLLPTAAMPLSKVPVIVLKDQVFPKSGDLAPCEFGVYVLEAKSV